MWFVHHGHDFLVVAKGDGLEEGFQDGRQFLQSLKRKRINNQPLATILNLTLTPTPHLTPTLTLILTQTNANSYFNFGIIS
jgi:hypothetical protein